MCNGYMPCKVVSGHLYILRKSYVTSLILCLKLPDHDAAAAVHLLGAVPQAESKRLLLNETESMRTRACCTTKTCIAFTGRPQWLHVQGGFSVEGSTQSDSAALNLRGRCASAVPVTPDPYLLPCPQVIPPPYLLAPRGIGILIGGTVLSLQAMPLSRPALYLLLCG
jgi:hypothetical protein